jgi:mannose-1-phosphate guanylyltransferase/mannose-1-phosphate guanylyltransferase/mannose-6-phosphate isomerase
VPADAAIVPVILSGGAGTRLWPLSRELYPKQLLPLTSDKSLLQDTAQRVADARFAAPLIVCNDAHRFIIAEQLRALDIRPRGIVLEPMARNTGPAVAAAAAILAETLPPETLMLVLASDHVVRERGNFLRAVDTAAAAARRGRLVCLAITPTHAETGYGYIRRSAALDGIAGAFAVERFVEKPDAATAKRYLDEGTWSWNASMFMFPIGLFQAELMRYEPAIADAVRAAVTSGTRDLDFTRLDADAFGRAVSKSVDYAVMERTDKAAVVPADLGWSDVGAWSALWDLGAKDAHGNVKCYSRPWASTTQSSSRPRTWCWWPTRTRCRTSRRSSSNSNRRTAARRSPTRWSTARGAATRPSTWARASRSSASP